MYHITPSRSRIVSFSKDSIPKKYELNSIAFAELFYFSSSLHESGNSLSLLESWDIQLCQSCGSEEKKLNGQQTATESFRKDGCWFLIRPTFIHSSLSTAGMRKLNSQKQKMSY